VHVLAALTLKHARYHVPVFRDTTLTHRTGARMLFICRIAILAAEHVHQGVLNPVGRVAFNGICAYFLVFNFAGAVSGVDYGAYRFPASEQTSTERAGFEHFQRLAALLGHSVCKKSVIALSQADQSVNEIHNYGGNSYEDKGVNDTPPPGFENLIRIINHHRPMG